MKKREVVYTQMQHDGQLFTHKLRVPPPTLNVFRSYCTYMDMHRVVQLCRIN